MQLRRELAASEDYERLSARATELRKGLAEAPIVATSDPLPAAFNATLGRFVPIGGTEGVALLLTVVVELISCFGLAGLTVLTSDKQNPQRSASPGSSSSLALIAKPEAATQPAGDKTAEAAPEPAQGQSPDVAQVIHFPSVRARAGACPPTTTNALHKPARAPAGQAIGRARSRPPTCPKADRIAVAQLAHSPAQDGTPALLGQRP